MSESWIQIQNKPIKEMKKLNLKLAISRHICNDTGLTIMNVTGNQQGGKTTYGMNSLHEIYEGDEDEVMDHIVMSVSDFTKKIDDALTNNYRHRALQWDDMSVEGGASLWVSNPLLVRYLAALGDTLGIAVKGLILTSPSGDMIKAFRNYQKYIVQIHNGRNKYDRVAKGYFIGKSPMMQRYCQPSFEDRYDIRIPYYERYANMRRDISIKAVRDMRSLNQPQPEQDKPHKQTIKDKVFELKRDLEAGVFGDMSFKALCKANRIDYGYACNVI